MNLIFLDVDGVLNSTNNLVKVYNKTGRPHSGYDYPFDETCLKNLQILVNQTNSNLVITSTWRKDKEGIKILLQKLKEYNLDEKVIGYTPVLNSFRGVEILKFFSTLQDKPNFIILDDDSDMSKLLPYLIETNAQSGLTTENVQQAINKLNLSFLKKSREDGLER